MRVPPRLKLKRLKIMGGGKVAFDQPFHDGVNIIAGSNGSGKSSIADFIFYALGGEITRWKKHSLWCDLTLAEIETNSGTLTLKREVSEVIMRPMSIYYGPLEEAEKHAAEGWHEFSYKRNDNTQSFSQILFKALEIPEAISDGTSNITMNQVLRLLYVDQMSSIQRIFRDDVTRDTPETRQAVGDMMCGIGGYELFDKELRLRAKNKQHAELTTRLRNLMAVAASHGRSVRGEQVDEELAKTSELLSKNNIELERVSGEFSENESISKEAEKERRQLFSSLKSLKRDLQDAEDELTTVEIDLQENVEFVDYLKGSLTAFDDASFTFNTLGQIEFEYCPSCFSPIAHKEPNEGECHLCGSEVDHSTEKEKVFAVRVDLTEQLRESEMLLTERRVSLDKLKGKVRTLRLEHRKQSSLYSSMTSTALTGREAKLASLNREIGSLEMQIVSLHERKGLAKEIDELAKQKEEINNQISTLKDDIETIKASRKKRETVVKTGISVKAGEFLKNDLTEHSDFLDDALDYIGFDFADDWMAINGKRNVSTSASGMVVLKNSLFMGLFMAAATDDKYNYPRFILMDNVEDKGMVQERSQNFQRLICEASDGLEEQHQIIFTTSMLNPDLDKEEYIVGEKYSHEHRTLRLEQS